MRTQPFRSSSLFPFFGLVLISIFAVAQPSLAQRTQQPGQQAGQQQPTQQDRPGGDSPNNPRRAPNQGRPGDRLDLSNLNLDLRTVTGVGNNLENPDWGAANIELLRKAVADYGDGSSLASGESRASARQISNLCMAQDASIENQVNATDFVWQWGQFLDHDIDLTPIASPVEELPIAVPTGDPWFDPTGTGEEQIPFERSSYNTVEGVRQQVNEITAYIDASNVYGSDPERAEALRTLDGTGRLLTSDGDLLPYNDAGLPNAPTNGAAFFLAGDFRANEQVVLTAMHTLFVREHNFWAEQIASANPDLNGDQIYQFARALIGAEMQAITYREFLPVFLGNNALPPYRGYNPRVDPSIANEFATAAYRVGHTMLSSEILRLEEDGSKSEEGSLSLAQAFFNPSAIEQNGIDSLLRGLASKRAQNVDLHVIDDVRNLLFGPPGSGGLDLASLNIQRGRDHGLADYNATRAAYGLPRYRRIEQITSDLEAIDQLRQAYGSVDDIDLWVAGLAEPHVPGSMVGPTFRAILADQFLRLRDGDRFWYQSALPEELVQLVEEQTLSRIIRRNTDVGASLQHKVFLMP